MSEKAVLAVIRAAKRLTEQWGERKAFPTRILVDRDSFDRLLGAVDAYEHGKDAQDRIRGEK